MNHILYVENKTYLYIVTICVKDCFSRKLLGLIPLKRKLSKEVANALDKLILELNQACKVFYTDSGLEFSGDCNRVYEKHGIEHVTTKDFVQKASITERANLVIKQRLYKIMASNNNFLWIDRLEDVKNAYNESFNRNLAMTPNEAFEAKNQSRVFYNTVTKRENKALSENVEKFTFNINQSVRILLQQPFGKSYVGNYSQVIYVITERFMSPGHIEKYRVKEFLSGEVLDGSFYSQELVPVNVAFDQKGKKIEKIYSFRLEDNIEYVQVKYEGESKKTWKKYSDLLTPHNN